VKNYDCAEKGERFESEPRQKSGVRNLIEGPGRMHTQGKPFVRTGKGTDVSSGEERVIWIGQPYKDGKIVGPTTSHAVTKKWHPVGRGWGYSSLLWKTTLNGTRRGVKSDCGKIWLGTARKFVEGGETGAVGLLSKKIKFLDMSESIEERGVGGRKSKRRQKGRGGSDKKRGGGENFLNPRDLKSGGFL